MRQRKISARDLWRAQLELSDRHRSWCRSMAATDIDATEAWLLGGAFVEYIYSRPAALVDYKWRHVSWTTSTEVQAALGDMCGLPAFMAVYHPGDEWQFQVWPLNDEAKQYVPVEHRGEHVSEVRYVRLMHRVRDAHCCRDWTPAGGES
jgi:hypothetical protein